MSDQQIRAAERKAAQLAMDGADHREYAQWLMRAHAEIVAGSPSLDYWSTLYATLWSDCRSYGWSQLWLQMKSALMVYRQD